jgi:gas vesicle protein
MSYAGKAARGRRGAQRDDVMSGAASRRTPSATRAPQREIALAPIPRSYRPSERTDDAETDWQRVAIFATGTVLGAVVGVGAALLFAPQTGDEARRNLARHGRRLRSRTANAWDDLRDELQWAARRGRRRLARSLRGRRERRAERAVDEMEA